MHEIPTTSELQERIRHEATRSGRPILEGGRGQPNWLATVPRSALFVLGQFAVAEADAASAHDHWGMTPPREGIADRLGDWLAGDASAGADFLDAATRYGISELGFDADDWVLELVRGVLGDGYPAPTRMLPHVERVLERYVVEATGFDARPGALELFGTEGGAAAMAYVFRALQENHLVGRGDKVAIATPIFTPYLQIPVLEDFGFEVVELHTRHDAPTHFTDTVLDQLLDPTIKAFFLVNPGNPDSRVLPPDDLHRLADLVFEHRRDLVVVADTVYATFVRGFRGIVGSLPHNTICLHSFSKNFGATGSRLGFVAMHRDHVTDRLLQEQDASRRRALAERYSSVSSEPSRLSFMARLVAESREVALHNIAGLATPNQVQMALFALAHLSPAGPGYVAATHDELARRRSALLDGLGATPAEADDQDSLYYALVDVASVARLAHGPAFADWLVATVVPADVVLRLASHHAVVVLPGQIFDADSWEVRVSLASLTVDELAQVRQAIRRVVDDLAESWRAGRTT